MMKHTSLSGLYRLPRWRRRSALLVATLLAFTSVARVTAAVDSQPIACGSVVTRALAAGEEHLYRAVIGDTPGVVDVTDVSGTIGILRIKTFASNGTEFETCSGSQEVSLGDVFGISDCIGEEAGTYAVAFNAVVAGPENCGVPLTCGAPQAASLTVAGEVDSFTFPATEAQQIRITANDPNDPGRLLRLRLFDSQGADWWGESCSGSLDASILSSGTHTLLVSACDGTSAGAYGVTWERLAGCGPQSPSDEVAYVFNAVGGTLAAIRTADNRVESLVPALTSPDGDDSNTIRASRDGAFVYVSTPTSPVIAAVNTSTNRVSGNAVVPAIAVTFALHPDGRHLYAPARVAGGVMIIDTTTLKSTATIAVDDVQDGAGIATSPDGLRLYVLVPPKIVVIDTLTAAVNGFIEDDSALSDVSDIRISPSGQFAYVFAPRRASIAVVDLQSGVAVDHIDVPVLDLEFSADSSRAYGTQDLGSSGAVAVIDAMQHEVVDSIPLPDSRGPWGIGISPTTGLLYVADTLANVEGGQQEEPGLVVVDPVSRTVVGSANTFGDNPTDVVLVRPPDGLCAGDEERQSKVTVGELVTSVNFAIDGCPGEQSVEGAAAAAGPPQ